MRLTSHLGLSLFLFVFFTAVQVPSADAATLSGELVKINGTSHQFRIVGHGGSYTAPAGFSLEALDGKTVQVEIASGRVVNIIETPVPIDPIEHGFETVSGELVVRDAATGSFAIAGDGRVFAAPAGTDVTLYAGRRVQLRLDQQGRLVEIQSAPAAGVAPRSDYYYPPTGAVASSVGLCSYEGKGYSDGVSVCQSGTRYRCEAGTWRNEGACAPIADMSCSALGSSYADGATRCEDGTQFRCDRGQWRSLGTTCPTATDLSEARIPRTCALGGSTVADGSSMCREGITFRCMYGQWVNVGSPCS